MIIHPEVIVTPDTPTVKFREPKENVDLSIEIPKILNAQGWGLGTYFNVQFISHDKTELLSMARYVVSYENESLQTSNPDSRNPNTKIVAARSATRVSEWSCLKQPKEDLEIKWNPGKKVFQVKSGDDVVYENEDKSVAEKFRDAA